MSSDAAGTILQAGQVNKNDWVLLGEASVTSGTEARVTWDTSYYDLKFTAGGEISATGDVYVSPISSSGSGLSMVAGSRIAGNSSGGLTSASATWSNNVIVLPGDEVNTRYVIEGTSVRTTSAQWRCWNVWGSRTGSTNGQILWTGSQSNGTETRGLRINANGTFLSARITVWGRLPY